ncbi:MAG: hypothetical protein QXN17_08315 [Nitrososphaerota archaeon]
MPRARNERRRLKGLVILSTNGVGIIGSHIVDRLVEEGEVVKIAEQFQRWQAREYNSQTRGNKACGIEPRERKSHGPSFSP